MKVLHVIPDLGVGGAETMLAQLATGLLSHGIDSRILLLKSGGPLKGSVVRAGVLVDELDARNAVVVVPKLISFCSRLRRQWQPEVVQGWMYHANVVALIAERALSGRPSVVWNIRGAHTDLKREDRQLRISIRVGAALSRYPAAIIYNSVISANLHEQKLGYCMDKRHVIPNGFDTELWTPSESSRAALQRELGFSPEALLVGIVARYHAIKNHTGLLQAASRIKAVIPNVRFVLVGSGVSADNPELTSLIREVGLENSTYLLGEQSDVHRIISALDLLVSGSYVEGFPNVIAEAMSSGIPCVGTDAGDTGLLIRDCGRVVPVGDMDALAASCIEVLSSSVETRRAMGVRGRKKIIENYSISSVVGRYADLYLNVLKN